MLHQKRAPTLAFLCRSSKLPASLVPLTRACIQMTKMDQTPTSPNSRSHHSNTPTIKTQPPAPQPPSDAPQPDASSSHTHSSPSRRGTAQSHRSLSLLPSPRASSHSHPSTGIPSNPSIPAYFPLISRHNSPSPVPQPPSPQPPSPQPSPRHRRTERQRLADDEPVPRGLWYFAGGRGKPPTGARLREWKRTDRKRRSERDKEAKGKGNKFGPWQRLGAFFGRKKSGETES